MTALEYFAWGFIWTMPAWAYVCTNYAMKVSE